MFDVDWSDPNRESVGDRRVRKQKQHSRGKERDQTGGEYGYDEDDNEEDLGADDQSGNRTSGSVRSSVSSTERQFGFFGGKHRKKGGTSSQKGKAKSLASSSLHTSTIEEQPHKETPLSSSQGRQRPKIPGSDQSPGLAPKRFSSEFDLCPLSYATCKPGQHHTVAISSIIMDSRELGFCPLAGRPEVAFLLPVSPSALRHHGLRMGNALSSTQALSKTRAQPHTRRIPLSKTANDSLGFAESVFNDLDDTDRAPGGSLFGCDITNPQPGFTTLFQELGDGVSMVTKTQRVSTRERMDEDSDFLVFMTHISSGDPQPQRPSSPVKSS